MIPAVDHSLLSPSGRVSKRARKAAIAREAAKLFPDGFQMKQLPAQPSERERDLAHAAELRFLAERGMCPRKYRREADRLEQKWAAQSHTKEDSTQMGTQHAPWDGAR